MPLSLWAKRDRHANARNLTGSDQTTAVYNEYAASLTSVNLCQSGPFSEGEIPIWQMSKSIPCVWNLRMIVNFFTTFGRIKVV